MDKDILELNNTAKSGIINVFIRHFESDATRMSEALDDFRASRHPNVMLMCIPNP